MDDLHGALGHWFFTVETPMPIRITPPQDTNQPQPFVWAFTKSKSPYASIRGMGTPMKRLFVLGIALCPIGTANARTPNIHCPGDNTVEMRYCAGVSVNQSNAKLKKMIGSNQFKQWQEVTRAMCAKAYAPYKEGTIYPQLAVGCEDHLNHAMLKEFEPLGN
jgi:hypothetical protein